MYTHIYTYIYICFSTYMYLHMYMYIYIHIHVCTYMYLYTYIHIRTQHTDTGTFEIFQHGHSSFLPLTSRTPSPHLSPEAAVCSPACSTVCAESLRWFGDAHKGGDALMPSSSGGAIRCDSGAGTQVFFLARVCVCMYVLRMYTTGEYI